MTTVPITITLNLPLETIEKYLPKLLEEKTNDIEDIVKSYKEEKLESMLNGIDIPVEAKNRIRKLKDDYQTGKSLDMNEVWSLMTEYKSQLSTVDVNQLSNLLRDEKKEEEKLNQLLNLLKDEKKEEEKPAGFDFGQMMNTLGPMLNQLGGNNQRGRGKRRH